MDVLIVGPPPLMPPVSQAERTAIAAIANPVRAALRALLKTANM